MASSLAFHREMMERVLEDSSMTVVGKGLGVERLIVKLVQLACLRADIFKQRAKQCASVSRNSESSSSTTKSSLANSLKPSKAPLTFVIMGKQQSSGAKEWEFLRRAVSSMGGIENGCTPPVYVTASFSKKARKDMYRAGGCFILTTRVMLHDSLDDIFDLAQVTGVIVTQAHLLFENSNERFILDIFHANNSPFKGWVRAFSDKPERLGGQFGFLAGVMSALGITKMHLWPRFHTSVRSTLENRNSSGSDDEGRNMSGGSRAAYVCSQDLSENMRGIQSEVVTLIDGILEDVKKSAKVDMSGWKVEEALFKDFSHSITAQLAPIWNKVSPRNKASIRDIHLLSGLLPILLDNDPWIFYNQLMTRRKARDANQEHIPDWVHTDPASRLLEFTKRRIYKIKARKQKKRKLAGPPSPKRARVAPSASKHVFDPDLRTAVVIGKDIGGITQEFELRVKLEEAPKLKMLRKVMAEISSKLDEQRKNPKPKNPRVDDVLEYVGMVARSGADTVILCKDAHTCRIINDRLEKEKAICADHKLADKFFGNRLARFLELHGQHSLRGILSADPWDFGLQADQAALLLLQEDLYYGEWRNTKEIQEPSVEESTARAGRLNGEGGGGNSATRKSGPESHRSDMRSMTMSMEERLVACEGVLRLRFAQRDVASSSQQSLEQPSQEDHAKGQITRDRTVIFPFDSCDRQLSILDELSPKFVVLYQPDVRAMRNIEVYQAEHPSRSVELYFLQYKDSVEEQKYLSEISREQSMFVKLIDEKAHLVLPQRYKSNASAIKMARRAEERRVVGVNASTGEAIYATTAGLKPGGARKEHEMQLVIVDAREDRCHLPRLLHREGVMIKTATLTIGDYVLSPEMVVERKSVPDLVQSLTSGRLHDQATGMARYYENQFLLIEFAENSVFSLAHNITGGGYGSAIGASFLRVITQLVLLIIHFPKLRILWSSKPIMSVQIFKALKQNYGQPDVGTATLHGKHAKLHSAVKKVRKEPGAAAGVGQGDDGDDDDSDDDLEALRAPQRSATAIEVLLELPGVTHHNYGKIAQHVKNLRELSTMTEAQLQPLLGTAGAKLLFKFFNDVQIKPAQMSGSKTASIIIPPPQSVGTLL